MLNLRKLAFGLALLVLPAALFAQQPLTLRDAVQMALEKNPLRKVAMAETRIARANVREARSALFPRIVFSETAIRGNDPVYVFGTKLRQQRFTAADFSLNQLNTPTPIGNFASKFSGQWRLFDSFQNYRSIDRARLMNDAASEQLERADQELISRVVHSYYGVLLARRRLTVAEDAVKTAIAIQDQSRNRVEIGLTVDADLLSSQVLTASRQQELIRARNDLSYATAQLAIVVGVAAEALTSPSDVLADRMFSTTGLAALEQHALLQRPDLRRLRSEQGAQQQSVTIAKSSFGPRIDTFGSWQTDSHSLGWNDGNNWTAGIEVQFDLFSGGAKAARLQREKAVSERIAAMRSAFEDSVRLEVRRAYYDYDAAQQQVAVAKAATQQATESLRILRDRYDAGLTTVTELLRAEEASNRAQTDYWDAVYRVQTGFANLELASGKLTIDSPVVTP